MKAPASFESRTPAETAATRKAVSTCARARTFKAPNGPRLLRRARLLRAFRGRGVAGLHLLELDVVGDLEGQQRRLEAGRRVRRRRLLRRVGRPELVDLGRRPPARAAPARARPRPAHGPRRRRRRAGDHSESRPTTAAHRATAAAGGRAWSPSTSTPPSTRSTTPSPNAARTSIRQSARAADDADLVARRGVDEGPYCAPDEAEDARRVDDIGDAHALGVVGLVMRRDGLCGHQPATPSSSPSMAWMRRHAVTNQ